MSEGGRGGAEVRWLLPHDAGREAVVAHRVLSDMDRLVDRLGEAYLEVAEYAALGREGLALEVLPVSRRIVEAFFEAVLAGRAPEAAALDVLPDMGRRRLEMGVPLEPMLHVYRIAGRVVWHAIVSATREGEEMVLADLGAEWMDYIDRAASIAAAAYLAASTDQIREVDARRGALLEGLLAADTPADVAAVSVRFSVTLASAYAPVLMEGRQASVEVDRVLASAPDGTIGGSRAGRLLLLVPGGVGDPGVLWRAAGRPLLAWGDPAAPGPELLAEVGHAEAILAAAAAAGAQPGVFGPDDLVLERLLGADPRVARALRRRVVEVLARRDHDGLLTSTLRAYLATGSVPETARRQFVHPNTVLYRLRRVRELTGLDPRVPTQAAQLVLALGLGSGGEV